MYIRKSLSVGSTLVAGGLAGMCNWLVAIPMDVVKSRLQAAPEVRTGHDLDRRRSLGSSVTCCTDLPPDPQGTYTGAVDVLKQLLAKEGPRALWKGAVPVLMRSPHHIMGGYSAGFALSGAISTHERRPATRK